MGGAIGSIFGIGSTPAPVVLQAPMQANEEVKKQAKKARSVLLSTEGGIAGTELQAGTTGGRTTILGN